MILAAKKNSLVGYTIVINFHLTKKPVIYSKIVPLKIMIIVLEF